ncbi:FAD:protein FMN transferase [Salegentibacter sp. F188]|uniref:FAD:protein FMN transferase n=1 Tax=Autumnicola patrickiae TaxID=3075591 RepID=A0ABU3E571_9FLAO|nr:FAD:protein FMN transferase [Salegentibacter sp. F188]MDT0691048.1 FAD:protein FMN transferase [Salegentibacter sp. F188]
MKNLSQVMKIMLLTIMAGRRSKIRNKCFLLLILIGFFSCSEDKPEKNIASGSALGTTYHISYFSASELDVETSLDSIFRVINKSMSTYQDDSDISRINDGEIDIVVDSNFVEVYRSSEKVFRESRGYFDPTVGLLVNAYGFGPEGYVKNPQSYEIDSIMTYIGFDKLSLTADRRIKKEFSEVHLDFNAIAKGYAIDVIALYFDNNNVENYLIELGGELVGKGRNIESDNPWRVAIDDPRQEEGERTFQTVLALENRALATSGNYRKYREDTLTGEAYVHTINPLTGKAQQSNLLSASVLAKNCTLADGYATAFMALGLEKSKEMLDRIEDVDVYFIYANNDNKIAVFSSEGFKDQIQK